MVNVVVLLVGLGTPVDDTPKEMRLSPVAGSLTLPAAPPTLVPDWLALQTKSGPAHVKLKTPSSGATKSKAGTRNLDLSAESPECQNSIFDTSGCRDPERIRRREQGALIAKAGVGLGFVVAALSVFMVTQVASGTGISGNY